MSATVCLPANRWAAHRIAMLLIVRVSTFVYSFCRLISLQLKWSDTIWLCGGEWAKWWICSQLYPEHKSKARWSIYDYILLNKKHYYYDYLFISAKNEWSKNYKTWHFDITNISDLSMYSSEFMLFNCFHFNCEGITSLWDRLVFGVTVWLLPGGGWGRAGKWIVDTVVQTIASAASAIIRDKRQINLIKMEYAYIML